ncbi:zinc-binding alcohol dehydrogenase family protein [Microvirga sp. VF16]|uniref:zinc-binding alcohol dehydrogenase family protein n=1 Tax=Microvirga sp. VF16 TaxID=2807101 RepID=UPI00193CDCBF|nr:zinc-binding alcohol dehydrogenase family protein [Microvirga sp. VF16]QRM33132.1 zinc-binding alcohol dehydrogenase family protein [Microvirga sp. VF16]
MKSIGLFKSLPIKDPNSLIDRDLPEPTPGDADLLVRVAAIAVNPADCRVRRHKADDGQFAVLGWDVAGEVIKVGRTASGFSAGDAVYYAGDLTRPGGNSEFQAVHAAIVGHRPKSITPAEAAALPLTALTAWEALFERLGLSLTGLAGDRTLLIVGAAGGVGSMAIQLARLVPGLTVVATASRPQSRAWCERLGAHAVIDHFGDMAAQLTALGRPAPELILLLNDPDRHYPVLAEVLAPQGRICSVVPFDHPPDINLIMRKSAGFMWEFMFTRPMFATADRARQGAILNAIAAMIDDGRLVSTATETLGLINAANLRVAHARLESGRTLGKLVLSGF